MSYTHSKPPDEVCFSGGLFIRIDIVVPFLKPRDGEFRVVPLTSYSMKFFAPLSLKKVDVPPVTRPSPPAARGCGEGSFCLSRRRRGI